MNKFIHQYMWSADLDHYYPWATWQGTAVTIGACLLFSAIVSWFIVFVIKPTPGCIYEGPLPFGFYMGDPNKRLRK